MKNQVINRFQRTDSQEMKHDGIDAVVFAGPGLVATGYKGKSSKYAFNYRFRTQEQMNAHISSFFMGAKMEQDRKEKRRSEKKEFKTSLVVGDILYSSWGYDQTNIDYYQVVEVSPTKKSVKLRGINQSKFREGGSMSDYGKCSPIKDDFSSGAFSKKVQPNDWISLNSFSSASKWDGKPKSWSDGH